MCFGILCLIFHVLSTVAMENTFMPISHLLLPYLDYFTQPFPVGDVFSRFDWLLSYKFTVSPLHIIMCFLVCSIRKFLKCTFTL